MLIDNRQYNDGNLQACNGTVNTVNSRCKITTSDCATSYDVHSARWKRLAPRFGSNCLLCFVNSGSRQSKKSLSCE